MKKLVEIRFHGRGGQGAKTAADLLAQTALEAGKYMQSFPEYGPERAGAPIRAFARISDEPIDLHCGVSNPDIVVVIDPTLLTVTPPVTEGLDTKGILVVNTTEDSNAVRKILNFTGTEVYTVDASKIAYEEMGAALPNTPMLGALIKVSSVVSVDKLKEVLLRKFGKKMSPEKVQGNIRAIDKAAEQVKKN